MERSDIDRTWRKSTYSGGANGACVEVGNGQGAILVRDTTDRAAGHIDVVPEAWRAFVNGLK